MRRAELGGWTADSLGHEAEYCLGRSLTLARRADDPLLVAYVGVRQAQQAAECGHAPVATALAENAGRTRGLSDRDRALCSVREARGHARMRPEKIKSRGPVHDLGTSTTAS